MLGDSVTTDHISPAGAIRPDSPAGKYLIEHGVERREFNSYGARRGNHEVMVRGTFANVRLRNQLVTGSEGTWTVHLPDGEEGPIFDIASRYRAEGVPTIVIAGKEYGSGSSRDWAAKGPNLLGVRAVIAESYERIHRSNLLMMGILPLQFLDGDTPASLGLTGREEFSIAGVENGEAREVTVRADGKEFARACPPRHAARAGVLSARWHPPVRPQTPPRLIRTPTRGSASREAVLESDGSLPAYVRRAIARGEDPAGPRAAAREGARARVPHRRRATSTGSTRTSSSKRCSPRRSARGEERRRAALKALR